MEAWSASSIHQWLWSCTGNFGYKRYRSCMMLGPLSIRKGLVCTVVSSLHALDTAVLRRPAVHHIWNRFALTRVQSKWTRRKLSRSEQHVSMFGDEPSAKGLTNPSTVQKVSKSKTVLWWLMLMFMSIVFFILRQLYCMAAERLWRSTLCVCLNGLLSNLSYACRSDFHPAMIP